MVDELRAVVGVKAEHHERKLRQDQGAHRKQKRFADALHSGLDLPRTHRVDARDVLHALDAVMFALMDRIDAHQARTTIGSWRLAHPDRVAQRARVGVVPTAAPASQRSCAGCTGARQSVASRSSRASPYSR